MDLGKTYSNVKGRVFRRISRKGNPFWAVASARTLEAVQHFKDAGNTAEAERTLRQWYVDLGARGTAGMAEILVREFEGLGFDSETAQAAEKYLSHTKAGLI